MGGDRNVQLGDDNILTSIFLARAFVKRNSIHHQHGFELK